jgi:hypothetical protein
MRVEQGKSLATLGLGFVGGGGAGMFIKDAGPVTAALFMVGSLTLVCIGFVYSRRTERREFLDEREDCQGDCRGKVERRKLWRLPDSLPERKGLPVCKSCFTKEMGNSPNPFTHSLAYAKKGEEYEKTRMGKRERRDNERRRREFSAALAAEMDPLEQRGLSPEEKALIRASQAEPRSPQPPKRGP